MTTTTTKTAVAAKITTKLFVEELKWVNRFVETKTTIPILGNVMIVATDGRLTLTTTDLELGAVSEMETNNSVRRATTTKGHLKTTMKLILCLFLAPAAWSQISSLPASPWHDSTDPSPKLSAADITKLTDERNHLTWVLKSAEAMLRTRSFIERVHVFCRHQSEVDQSEDAYYKLLNQHDRPDSYLLQMAQMVLDGSYGVMYLCQEHIIAYQLDIPTDDDEKRIANNAKARIAEIDKQLSTVK